LDGGMMTKIYRVSPGNFGDDLNEILIEKRLGEHFQGNVYLNMNKNYDVNDDDTVIVAIGTILNKLVPEKGTKIVLGAGVGYGAIPTVNDSWDVKFVRGPLTAKKFNGLSIPYITDPAILLANMEFSSPQQQDLIGYVPHHACANPLWEQTCNELGIKYIDPRNSFTKVMNELRSCRLILAEAMHGAIVADAMRIPWIPISSAKKINSFKWNDWCSSMELNYEPQLVSGLWDVDDASIYKKITSGVKKKLVAHQLSKIIKKGKPMLSSDVVFNTKLEQVTDCYENVFSSLKS
jgi:succinoglycan biosynthesis protein ExoV